MAKKKPKKPSKQGTGTTNKQGGDKKKAGSACAKCEPEPPVQQGTPLRFCALYGIEISFSERAERTRGEATCSKWLVLPGIAFHSAQAKKKSATKKHPKKPGKKANKAGGSSDESDDKDAFRLYDPPIGDEALPKVICLTAVRYNLVDDDNAETKVTAKLVDAEKCQSGVRTHQILRINNADDSTAVATARRWKQKASEFVSRQKRRLRIDNLLEAKKQLKVFTSNWDKDPEKSIEAGLKAWEELGKKPEDKEGEKKDGKDSKDKPDELEASLYPQNPTAASLMSTFPNTLASFAPEEMGWMTGIPGIVDVFRNLWTISKPPRVFEISAESCGDPKPDKLLEAGENLKVQLLVYPADEFQFKVRVPSPIKSSVGYDGRYVKESGEDQAAPKWESEVSEWETKKRNPLDFTSENAKEEEENSISKKNEALFKLAEKSGIVKEEEDDDEEEKDDDDEPAPLLEISQEKVLLPWSNRSSDEKDEDKADDDKDDQEDAKDNEEDGDDEEDEWDAMVEKPSIQLTRSATPSDGGDDDNSKSDDESGLSAVEDAALSILTLAQEIREVWNNVAGLSYTVGFGAEFEVSFFEGKFNCEWGWRDSPRVETRPELYSDNSPVLHEDKNLPFVVFSQHYKAKLKLLGIEAKLKLGIDLKFAGLQFRAALIGEISGEVHIDREATDEFCPVAGKYYQSEAETWTEGKIEGTLRLQAILLSADSLNVGGDIQTGYSVKGRLARGLRSDGDVGPALEYEWQFEGVKASVWFNIKGWKSKKKEVELVKEQEEPTKGCFPRVTSQAVVKARRITMELRQSCWDIKEKVQKRIGEVRCAYINRIFFLTEKETQTGMNPRRQNPLFYQYDGCPTAAWIDQLRAVSVKRQSSTWTAISDRLTYAWGAHDVTDDEIEGELNPEDDRDIAGEQAARMLWKLRVMLFFYKQIRTAISDADSLIKKTLATLLEQEKACLASENSVAKPAANSLLAASEKTKQLKGIWDKQKFVSFANGFTDYLAGLDVPTLYSKDLNPALLNQAYFDERGEIRIP